MTPGQKKAVARILKPFRACARKLGINPNKKWTIAEKKRIQACMVGVRRVARRKAKGST